jgi:hypothetical protein
MRRGSVLRGVLACFMMLLGVLGSFGMVYSASDLLPSDQTAAMLRAKEVMIGYEDGSMRWENTVTRAEAVKILLAAIGEVAPSLARSPMAFLDVSRSHWAFGHITMAAEIGLVRGRPGNLFDPEQGVTMAEFMVMVSRVYAGLGSRAGEPDPRVRVKPAWAEPEIVGWPDLVELVTGESLSVDLGYPASRGEVGVLTGLMMERLGLAYDLAGLVQRLSDDGTKMVLAVEDVGGPIEVLLDDEVLWFAEGAPAGPDSFVGRAVRIVLGSSGRASVVVKL